MTVKAISLVGLALFLGFVGCASEDESGDGDGSAGESGNPAGGTGTGGTGPGGRASGGNSGAGGRGGSAGSTSGGTSGTDAPGGMGGAECSGDEERFRELTTGPFACERNSECCVVIDSCLSEGRVVRAGDEAAALAAWPICDDYCNDCIPPKVVVGCYDGFCAGIEIDDEDFESPLRQTHCGIDDETMDPGADDTFGCGG